MSGAGSVDAIKGAGAGHEFPTEEVSWLKRDVLLFANSIGCTADELHFLYVCSNFVPNGPPTDSLPAQELHPNFAVFPTYSIILREYQSRICPSWQICKDRKVNLPD